MPPHGDEMGTGESARERPNQRLVQQITTPRNASERSALARVDYSDAFLVTRTGTADRTAEQWARDVLEGAPLIQRSGLVLGWTMLGLRLHSPWSSRFVLGWQVRQQTPDVVLIEAGPRFGLAAELQFERLPDAVLFSTSVQMNNPVARAVWSAVTPVHRWIVGHLLKQSAQR